MFKVGIVGATGYTGSELLRLLVTHPQVEVGVITSRSAAGTPVDALFPNLRGRLDLPFVAPDVDSLSGCDLVFFAAPNGTAMKIVPDLLEAGSRIVDLAADFRLRDPAVWEHWYGMPHACPHLLDEAVYGLPEMFRDEVRDARLVANPGCYPTSVVLGFLPLLESAGVDLAHLVADTKSGASGAGRKASVGTLLCEAGDNFKAYGIPGHRHLPEIRQSLGLIAGVSVGLTFVPHLLPMIRGIEATLYARLNSTLDDLQGLYEQRYADEPFVDVMPAGSHPETRSVRGVNMCRIAVHRPQGGDVLVISSVIDNLVKGAAGQALQNMNLMLDLEETSGLDAVALLP